MLISKFLRIGTSSRKLVQYSMLNSRRVCQFSSEITGEGNDKKQILEQVLKEIGMKKYKSIILEETDEIQRTKQRRLSKQDKLKLGLYVPKMILNPRMGVQNQSMYRQKICENLYDLQKSHLQTKVRILEKSIDSQTFTMDKYINTVYKDIYARYLISKGVGVEWNGRYSTYGMLNSKSIQQSPKSLVFDFMRANIQNIQKIQSIAPYSYLTQKFIPADLIQVQNLRKIGYYIKLSLTDFGRHQKSFSKLQQRGSTVQILVFCEYLQKLINPHCLCLIPGHKMVILKRSYIQKNKGIQEIKRIQKNKVNQNYKANQNNKINQNQNQNDVLPQIEQAGTGPEYLITSVQIFNKHKQYFGNKNYQKHLIFESDHMIGMKAAYNFNDQNESAQSHLQIISEIEGYQRNAGLYVVNGSTSISDYERVQQFKERGGEVHLLENVLDGEGRVNLSGNGAEGKSQQLPLPITDLQFEDRLVEALKQRLNFQELYDVFQDQVHSNKLTSQVLRFRLFDKFQMQINPNSYRLLQQYFASPQNNVVLHESKVKLPEMKGFNKPKQRRTYKKQVRQTLKQRTEYMSLSESIKSISNIPISSSVLGDMKAWFQKDEDGNVVSISQESKGQKGNLQQVTLSTDLISALSYIYSVQDQNNTLDSLLIQPQTFTEQILPLCLHLAFFRNKLEAGKRGRRSNKDQKRSNQAVRIIQSLKMIYLHPTMKASQRDIQVNSFISGSLKISSKKQFGYGYQAIRVWVCKNSDYLGDRQLKQAQVNDQLKNCSFIRKLYAQLIPLLPRNQALQTLEQMPFQKLNLLDRFMLEQIDAYILNMQHFYSKLMIKQAYEYTIDFYRNVVEQIFIGTVRKNVIAFPNQQDNFQHAVTIRRILQLLSVISPLFPFSAYHISKTQIMKWPEVQQRQKFYLNLLEYNALIKIRTQLKNKLQLNNFKHSQIIFPLTDQLSYSQNDLKKFFGVDKVSFQQPDVKEKKFGFKLRHNETLGGKGKIHVYQSKDHCIRCDPESKQKEHLCQSCVSYLEQNIGKQIQFYDHRSNSLLAQEQHKIQNSYKDHL